MAVSKQPSMTPETSSGEGLDEEISSRGEAKWKRFHPFRVVRKIFRRRIKREGTPVSDASKKSWSTSELQSVQDDPPGKCDVTSPLKIGLSVSHDSIFSPESNATGVGSDALSVPHGSSLSVHHTSIKNMFKDELFSRVRARRDSEDDDDDIGLPRSPCTSPTTVDILTQSLKEKSSKSHKNCSAGSLISMGSSENDEDSAGHSSGHSSRMSLIDRRSLDSDGDVDLNISVPLNHNAAHHKIAIKPKRKHGLPRRRINQIAAAKLNTLPATPEVIEDSGKVIQKSETTEFRYIEKRAEASISSRVETASKQSEWKVMHSSFSCNEMSDIAQSFIQEKTSSESNVHAIKGNKEYDYKYFNDESIKKPCSMISNTENPEILTLKESTDKMVAYNNDREKSSHSSIKQAFTENHEEFTFHETKHEENSLLLGNETMKNNFSTQENSDSSSFNCTLKNHIEEPIKVSSIVKNIERSESFKNIEKSFRPNEKNDNIFERDAIHSEIQYSHSKQEKNYETVNDLNSKCDMSKQITDSGSNVRTEKFEHFSPTVSNEPESITLENQDKNKLDIDCEFILKPLKKDDDLELICKQSNNEKEHLITTELFQNENVRNSKTLAMGVDDSGISVSHHASVQNDLKDMLVTEAHNYIAVEDKNEMYIQNLSSKSENVENDTWVSHTLPSKPDVTVSSSSTICDRTITEDKITISVNSKQNSEKSIKNTQGKDLRENAESFQKPSVLPKSSLNQKIPSKEKQSAKIIQKSNTTGVNLTTTSIKNLNSQKRVSVEIVPFSQRMKERKYQPISFASKETGIEKDKKTINGVERKLSDRKVTSKPKEVDKTNSRHSFSGVIPSDKKEILSDKKPQKPEKLQCPVQIRIHKSAVQQDSRDVTTKPNSNKERKNSFTKVTANDEKLPFQSPKTKPKEAKTNKDEKLIAENTKWEVKIQSANPQLANTSEMYSTDENNSITSEKSYASQNESQHSSENDYRELHLNHELESPSTKNNENISKSQKEIQPIQMDEPEPELLRVFARRSIKQKHSHKDKLSDSEERNNLDTSSEDLFPIEKADNSNEMISISHKSTVIKISEASKPHIKPDLKKKSKSFSEKERVLNRSVSPLKEINLIHSESPTKFTNEESISNESSHPRQRVVNIPDVPLNMPPDMMKSSYQESKVECLSISTKEESQQKVNTSSGHQPSGSVNGNVAHIGTVKENQDILSGKEPHAPSWLQLAQQRRELREQRERLLLGGSPNSFMDGSNKPSRSSKVWDMVNNFQKLQMT